MGSEPLEPEETDEVINEISFDESGTISQAGKAFHHSVEACDTTWGEWAGKRKIE